MVGGVVAIVTNPPLCIRDRYTACRSHMVAVRRVEPARAFVDGRAGYDHARDVRRPDRTRAVRYHAERSFARNAACHEVGRTVREWSSEREAPVGGDREVVAAVVTEDHRVSGRETGDRASYGIGRLHGEELSGLLKLTLFVKLRNLVTSNVFERTGLTVLVYTKLRMLRQ